METAGRACWPSGRGKLKPVVSGRTQLINFCVELKLRGRPMTATDDHRADRSPANRQSRLYSSQAASPECRTGETVGEGPGSRSGPCPLHVGEKRMDIERINSEFEQALKETRLAVEESRRLLERLNAAHEETRRVAEEPGCPYSEIPSSISPARKEEH
jgi:hypothetical protein